MILDKAINGYSDVIDYLLEIKLIFILFGRLLSAKIAAKFIKIMFGRASP